MSAPGRDGMMRELEEDQKRFQTAEDLLDLTFKPIREKYGITDERIEKAYTDYFSKIDRDI
jgi:hypothetical protein